jgi:hypothetical protein
MDHGGCRISTRRESTSTVHSVYYSTAKKTALPPQEACTRVQHDTLSLVRAIKIEIDRMIEQQVTRECARIKKI